MEKTYYPTHSRIGAWLVGVILGYMLHFGKGKVKQLPKLLVAICWILASSVMLTIVFGIYFMQQPTAPISVLGSAFYDSLSRIAWPMSLSWIIFACVHGYGGPANWLLSLLQWQPLARLSYSMYLLHLPVQLLLTASMRTAGSFSNFSAVIHT